MIRLFFSLALLACLAVACSSTQNATTDTMTVDPMAELGRNYELVQLNGTNLKARDFKKGLPTLMINPSTGTVSGTGGCNNYNTTVSLPSNEGRKKKDQVPTNRLTFGAVAGTKMSCPNMDTENSYFQLLGGKEWTYQLQGDKLVMEDANGATLVFMAR